MKTTPIVLASLIVIMAVSCKDKAAESVETVTGTQADKSQPASSDPDNANLNSVKENVVSSAAAVGKNDGNRKVIRTAAIRFRVKNVPQSTYAIENATTKFGGSVTYTNLQSTVLDSEQTKISQDSTLEITRYTVENNMTIRIPNTQLDTVIRIIAKQIDFLDARLIKADDVALKMLANELAQNRNQAYQKRMEKTIDSKSKKLNDAVNAENDLLTKNEQNDNTIIDNLSIQDKMRFSTITLDLYQRESIKNELLANPIDSDSFRPHIGLQIIDSLKTGWYMCEALVAFVIQLWFLILLGIIGTIGYKRYRRPKTA